MLHYAALKIGRALFVIWAAFTITFLLLFVLPAEPVDLLFDPAELNTIPEDVRAQVAANYGFDKPLLLQYLDRLGHAAVGDFGTSVQSGRPVTQALLEVLPSTLILSVGALLLAVVIGFAIALLATATRRPWLRNLLESLPSAAVSVPVFMFGIVLLQVFSFGLGWFPSFGDGGWQSLVLPLVTLAIPVSGPIAQLLVRSFTGEMGAGYVVTSFAKGATRGQVIVGDVFRNASLPALTIAGITFGNLIAGSVITETVFARPGVGRLTQGAINTLDIPVVQGIVVFVAASFALINLIVDLIYPLLDPRLRASLAARTS
ncbi:ABC transporter permease [Mycetocola reblochoni]|uniref:Dipeptide transport system permease protein DppB (TC 3.A.1.5.2) n=2 Tax=Mycetocola reblochoni TaxID=331618 RepID=A0A1R4IFT6_9MICO|nr:ABC transporter permease [Mycetocola reblochoni]RLP68975.1 ABC transporter permease [Mycetocola reblochoni]SJN18690.1 Dipeptide transport system permease protein DppB (TC 3.A.1.5.2) [Mycetocola reblochoni REB411]